MYFVTLLYAVLRTALLTNSAPHCLECYDFLGKYNVPVIDATALLQKLYTDFGAKSGADATANCTLTVTGKHHYRQHSPPAFTVPVSSQT